MFALNTDDQHPRQRQKQRQKQWQAYCELELIADASPAKPIFTFGLSLTWKLLIRALVDELVEEQQVEYLERCWTADELDQASSLKRFLTLIA